MKKIILIAISFFALTSCTKEEDAVTAASTDGLVLLHSTVNTINDTLSYTTNYTYNGNDLVKVTFDNGDYDQYTYLDGNISEIKCYVSDTLRDIKTFSYNSNNLISQYLVTQPRDSTAQKEVYSYPGNGNISFVATKGNLIAQTTPSHTGTVFFTNDEVTMIQAIYPVTGTKVRNYTYDQRKSPMKNVTGYSKISFVNSEAKGIFHNQLTNIYSVPGSPTVNNKKEFTYNAAFYPDTAVDFINNVAQEGITKYNY